MSGHHHLHSYAAASAAFYVALVPFVLLFAMMIGARFFENVRRARKPRPARPAIIALSAARGLLPTPD